MQRMPLAVLLLIATAVQGQAPPSTAGAPAQAPAAAPAPEAAPQAPEIQRLRALFAPDADHFQSMDAVPAAAVDAGPAAVPFLAGVLAGDTHEHLDRATLALAYIGGPEAVDALWRFQKTGQAPEVASRLAMALASVPLSAENRAFLEGCLEGEPMGGDWGRIVSAALSLGVLRATGSRGALERAAVPTGTIAAGAAREALRWLEQGSWKVAPQVEVEAPLQAVLRHGVPLSDKAAGFFDGGRQLFWIDREGTWTTASAEDGPGEAPSMSFEVHTSPDGERALVSVGIVFGPLAGEGYNYVLRKQGAGWVVQGVFFTWIS